MSASANNYPTSTDDYPTSANCHGDLNPGHDHDYSSGTDRNSDSYCDSSNADHNGDHMDDSDSKPGS